MEGTFRKRTAGITLVELLITVAVLGVALATLFVMVNAGVQLTLRNYSVNHSHQSARNSFQFLVGEMENSYSRFTLFRVHPETGAISIMANPANAGVEPPGLPGRSLSTAENGVAFWQFIGGPYRITDYTGETWIRFSMVNSAENALSGVPRVGDRLYIPTMEAEAVIRLVAGGGENVLATLDRVFQGRLSTTDGAVTTCQIFRRSAFYVRNGNLFYADSAPVGAGNVNAFVGAVSRGTGVTSRAPFSLIYDSPSAPTTSAQRVHISFESHDAALEARRLRTGTVSMPFTMSLRTGTPTVNLQ
jgi:hypothetical protein